MIGEYELEERDHGIAHFDIYYDEEVNGKRVTERHVAITRLSRNVNKKEVEDRYAEYENLSTCGGKYLYATSGKELLAKLIKADSFEKDVFTSLWQTYTSSFETKFSTLSND